MRDLFAQCSIEALGNAVRLRAADQREAGLDAPVVSLIHEMRGHVLRAVVHSQGKAACNPGSRSPTVLRDAPRNRFDGLVARSALGNMVSNTLPIPMLDGREDPRGGVVKGVGRKLRGALWGCAVSRACHVRRRVRRL